MDRRTLVTTGAALLVVRDAFAQSLIKSPSLDEFVTTLSDDRRFNALKSGVWTLHDILLLHNKATTSDAPNDGADELSRLVKIVEDSRFKAVEAAKTNDKAIELPQATIESAEKIGGVLPEIGVQPGSLLFTYLIDSYLKFNQVLLTQSSSTATPQSLCSVFPIRIWCPK